MTDEPQGTPPPNSGQVPGGYPPQPGAQGYQPAYAAPKHPQATAILVLGILGVVLCQVLAPFAWVMGNKAQKEIRANPTAFSGDGEVNAGRILGIIGTVMLVLAVLVFVGLGIALVAVGSSGGFDVTYSKNLLGA